MVGLEPNDTRTSQISANTAKDGTGTEYRLLCDANGRLSIVLSAAVAYNADVDDDSIPAGETRETENVLLYGYDTSGGSWERVQTDGSGKLKVYTP